MVIAGQQGRSTAWWSARTILAAALATAGCASTSSPAERAAPVAIASEAAGVDGARFVLASASRPSELHADDRESPSASGANTPHEVIAICEGAVVEPKQPTCFMTQAQSSGGLRFGAHRLRGGVKWCAGQEPLPWISSARAAKLDATYADLGLGERPESPAATVTKVIDHHYAIVRIAERPFLVSTAGQALPLRWAEGVAGAETGAPARAIMNGGTYPPSKGALLRMPDGLEPIYGIARDGTVIEVPRPHPDARYVGFSDVGGGHDSLWRWPSPAPGDPGRETWAVLHHAPDGSAAGDPDVYPTPRACSESAPTAGLRFSTAHRGLRFAAAGAELCLDRARGEEDKSYWRSSSAGPGRAGTERVTCASWKLELVPSPGGSPGKLAVRYLER